MNAKQILSASNIGNYRKRVTIQVTIQVFKYQFMYLCIQI